jgi:hypothetical protein
MRPGGEGNPDAARCGARSKRDGRPCRHWAGLRTDHPGEGRCWLHGGRAPIKSGRYSTLKRQAIRDKIRELEQDPDPLSLLPEVLLLRAIVHDYLDRYDENTEALLAWHASFRAGGDEGKPRQVLDLSDASRLVDRVGAMVKRIEDSRAANAVSQKDLFRTMELMGLAVRQHAPEECWGRILAAWEALRV